MEKGGSPSEHQREILCVCERESEIEREQERKRDRKRERQKERERSGRSDGSDSCLHRTSCVSFTELL